MALGDIVTVQLPRPVRDEALVPRGGTIDALPRLYEDDCLIAIDKPPDVPVHPAGRLLHHTVITALHREYRDFADPSLDVIPKLCHRLDLETSGVLLVAKTQQALTFVQAQFERRTVKKEYLVLVHGRVARRRRASWTCLSAPRSAAVATADAPCATTPASPRARAGAWRSAGATTRCCTSTC